MVNQVMLVGKVMTAPKSLGKGSQFSIMTWNHNRDGKRFEVRHFVDKWGECPSLRVDDIVAITGSLSRRSYEQNGETKWTTTVTAFTIQPVESRAAAQTQVAASTNGPNRSNESYPPTKETEGEEEYF